MNPYSSYPLDVSSISCMGYVSGVIDPNNAVIIYLWNPISNSYMAVTCNDNYVGHLPVFPRNDGTYVYGESITYLMDKNFYKSTQCVKLNRAKDLDTRIKELKDETLRDKEKFENIRNNRKKFNMNGQSR